MVPGIPSEMEERLLATLDTTVTDATVESFAACDFTLLDSADDETRQLGIEISGAGNATIVVTDRTRPLGRLKVELRGRQNTLFFDNRAWEGQCYGNLRVLGSDCVVFFNDIGAAYVALPDIYMRSTSQLLFWGRGASAVGCTIELEGAGQAVAIGDDALISSGVSIRNYDMHAMHDLVTGVLISRPPVDTVIERHVWLGQDVMLLNCERIGMGTVVGAQSLVKGVLPPRVVAAGTPARVIRENVSWGRDTYGMTAAERVSIGLSARP